METASRARTAGCRNESQRTSDPTRRCSVLLASHVLVIIASNMGWFSARGGVRWSMPATPANPAASAARARSTIWSIVSRICGRKTQNSSGLFTWQLLTGTHAGSARTALSSDPP